MIEKPAKKQRTCTISEQDGASILQRYTLKTVMAMLQEVSQCTDAKKIDWNGLVEKTSTGISNAREYQMLWRHLAYRDTLLEKLDDGAQALDDDSDLEMELEAFPSASGEISAEAAACVKVLIASAMLSDSNPSGSTVEAPLTINVPNFQSSRNVEQPSCSMQGTNIVVPVSVQKQPAPATTIADGFDKRKRKPWLEAEDLELIAAVQKCGEGNWANILRGDFKGDRTASQLSQRWAIIRKRHGNVNVGSSSNGPQLSEAQLAARHAMSLALNMPVKNMTSNTIGQAGGIGASKSFGSSSKNNSARTNGTNISPLAPATAEPSMASNNFSQSIKPSQENISSKPSPTGSVGPAEKPRAPVRKPILKPTPTPNSSDAMVRATAVAAGARIASPSDAATLLKAAQGKNAIHIMPSGGGSIKSSMPGGTSSISETLPNVHYIRTGLAHTPLSNYAAATPTVPSPGPQVKPAQNSNVTSSDGNVKQNSNAGSSSQAREVLVKKEVKTVGEVSVPELGSAVTKEQIQGDGTRVAEKSLELVQDDKKAPPVPSAGVKGAPGTAIPVSSLSLKRAELNGTSHIESPVNSSSLKTTDSKGVSGSKNPVSSLNLKAPDLKVTSSTPNLVSSSSMKTTELKGRNGAQNPVNLLTSKTVELKGPNGAQTVGSSTSKTGELKGPNGTQNPVSSLTSKTVELKGPNGSQNHVSLSTSKTTEIKGTSGSQNPASLSTLKTAELKRTTGAQNPVSSPIPKTAELKGTNGAKNPVSTLASKTADMKGTNSAQNPIRLAIPKAAELKGTNGGQNPVGKPILKTTELKGTNGGQNPVSAPTLKTSEVKGTRTGGQNPVGKPILKIVELKGTNGSQNPVSASTLKTSEVKCTTSGAQNPIGKPILKTTELKGTNGGQNPVSAPTLKTEVKGTTTGAQNPTRLAISKVAELKGTNGGQNPDSAPTLKTSEVKGTTTAVNTPALKTSESKGTSGAPNPVSSLTSKIAQNNQQTTVNTQPKNDGESGNNTKTLGSQPGACENKEKDSKNQKVNNMEEDSQSIAMDVEKDGENIDIEKMSVEKNDVETTK